MRDIEFRGKTEDCEWIYGSVLHNKHLALIFVQEKRLSEQVLPKTVGQFTGLFDADDNRIFEGDIIEAGQPKGSKMLYSVRWCDEIACFVFGGKVFFTFDVIDPRIAMKVIGNIHDNLELIDRLHD